MAEVTTTGFDQFSGALADVENIARPLGTRVVAVALLTIEEIMAPYPAQPPRDRAKTFNTYVRGKGHYPRAAFISNGAGGHKIKTKKGMKVRATSQQMDKRWTQKVEASENGDVVGELKNTASYSGWVMGPKDPDADPHQVPYHTDTGWVSADDAIIAAGPKIDASLATAADAIIKRIVGV